MNDSTMNGELGPVVSEHKGSFSTGGAGWYIGGVIFLAGVVGLSRGLVAASFGDVLYMLGVVGVASLWLLWLYSRWKQTLTIHTLGFVHNRLLREPLILRFDQIKEVRVRRTSDRRSLSGKSLHVQVTMYLHDGGNVVITNDIENVEQLATYAQPGGAAAGGPNQGGAIGSQEPSPWG